MRKTVKMLLAIVFSAAVLLLLGSGYAGTGTPEESRTVAAASAAGDIASELGENGTDWNRLAAEDPMWFFQLAAD